MTAATFFFAGYLTLHAADTNAPDQYSSVEERRLQNVIIQERAHIQKERAEIVIKKKELKTLEGGVDKKLAEIDNKLDQLRKLQQKIESLLEKKIGRRKETAAGFSQDIRENESC